MSSEKDGKVSGTEKDIPQPSRPSPWLVTMKAVVNCMPSPASPDVMIGALR